MQARTDIRTKPPPSTDPSTEETLLLQIKTMYARDKMFTAVGGSAIVSVNPNHTTQDSSDREILTRVSRATDTSPSKPVVSAHVFDIAESCYRHLSQDRTDQSIVINGESGSGKTANAQLVIRYLCQRSAKASATKESKVSKGAKLINAVLGPFITAQTTANKSASRVGTWTEMQFSEKGRLVGVKVLDYLLEKPRVTSSSNEERSFDVFYHFLAGARPDEKHAFELHDPSQFAYLSKSNHTLHTLVPGDSIKYHDLLDNLKAIGIGKRQQQQIFKLIAAILHLGNIQFVDEKDLMNDPASIVNYDQLECAAALLGVEADNLESTLTYKTKFIKNELYTVFLDADSARKQRDHFSSTLYSLIVRWIVEHINARLCQDSCANFIGILDFPGYQDTALNGIYNLLYNYAAEKTIQLSTNHFFGAEFDLYEKAGLLANRPVVRDNSAFIVMLDSRVSPSVFSLLDAASLATYKDKKADEKIAQDVIRAFEGSGIIVASRLGNNLFTVKHFLGSVDYATENFKLRNTDAISPDFINLARGDGKDCPASEDLFLRELFSDKMVLLERFVKDERVVVSAVNPSTPSRKPSIKRKSRVENDPLGLFDQATLIGNFQVSFEELLDTMSDTVPWFIYCIKPNDVCLPGTLDTRKLKVQLQALKIPELAAARSTHDFTFNISCEGFYLRYQAIIDPLDISETNKQKLCLEFVRLSGWTDTEMAVARDAVFLSELVYVSLEDEMGFLVKEQAKEKERNRLTMDTDSLKSSDDGSQYESDADSIYLFENRNDTFVYGETPRPILASDSTQSVFGKSNESLQPLTKAPKAPKSKMTGTRLRWVIFTWFVTWFMPPFLLRWCGMPRKDVQMAWREKFALCVIIGGCCAFLLFFIIGLGLAICPKVLILSPTEFMGRNTPDNAYTYAYGKVYDVGALITDHQNSYTIPPYAWSTFLGNVDTSNLFFKVPLWPRYCPNILTPAAGWDNQVNRPPQSTYNNFYYHNGVVQSSGNIKLYLEYMNKYAKGKLGWSAALVLLQATATRKLIIINNNVYDVSSYFSSTVDFFPEIKGIISNVGGDLTAQFNAALPNLTRRKQVIACMNEIFYVGVIDPRDSFACKISNYLLVASSAVILLIIGVKFVAALQFGSLDEPEDHDKFVICQVPCYTEGAESLANTLDSLALSKYDDKRKLLFVICDGMIIGSGNDRPTPRIVLDLLGVDPSYDPEPKIFLSLGDGDKQHNIGKVYSGLYDVQGHAVPFIVVVKVGKPYERQRPGNRGKRDSQMILMKFLSKVHFNSEMNPLELEIYHHMKNIIGVNPSYYEYILMVDSDTEVLPDAMNRLVSVMIHDSKIMGLCGETLLSNEKESLITMIQVYEYFISHHLAKQFESLFGTVTCLPGCFSMYRIRSPVNNIPLLISPQIINDYSENVVDTLHKKNLLHLGEDRYLTTLMLKHFPNYKLSFTPDAQCRTNAPAHWSVFKSQRRRWINSTVHNLFELVGLPGLCGVCCLSMRFVIYLELFSTLVQPSALVYLLYLIVTLIITPTDSNSYTFPLVSVIMIAGKVSFGVMTQGIYGLQIIIFILKRQWGMIIWMIIYLIATPVFAFYLPLYRHAHPCLCLLCSFWRFDDFSWGNTRMVVGEDGKKSAIPVECLPFDPSIIPLKKWQSDPTPTPPPYATSLSKRHSITSITPSFNSKHSTFKRPPTDDELYTQLKHLLTGADLMTITKKQVREDLGMFFGVDLAGRKDTVNAMIERILSGM